MRWEAAISEEVKLEVTVANASPHGPDVTLAISGDLRTGYRIRVFGYHYLAFETTAGGKWELLYRSPIALDPAATAYRLVFWRADNIFYAELDGRRFLEYHEPFAYHGAHHHTFAIGRMGGQDKLLQIHALRVFQRQSPRYVDILEPGRVLLRNGHAGEADELFQHIYRTHTEPALRWEAAYLSALAATEARKDAALTLVAIDDANPFRLRALQQLALHRCAHHDIERAVAAAQLVSLHSPEDPTPRRVAQYLIEQLPRLDAQHQRQYLAAIACLAIDTLTIHAPLDSLEPLHGMPLAELTLGAGNITDLTPLHGMPLRLLNCAMNCIRDLGPLHGMPLRHLQVQFNKIDELTPLAGSPLSYLHVAHNQLTDLTKLTGVPLDHLLCHGNRLSELSPLRDSALTFLSCHCNEIDDLTPLHGLPLSSLFCQCNRITSLSALAHCPLEYLDVRANPLDSLAPLGKLPLAYLRCDGCWIDSFAPLADLPLQTLTCGGNPTHDLRPLHGLPLETLDIGDIALTAANLAVLRQLPLRHLCCALVDPAVDRLIAEHPTLQTLHAHRLAYVAPLLPRLRQALLAFRAAPALPPTGAAYLRPLATSIGAAAYLALPLATSRAEAEAFCRWQGGHLVCPTTPEQHTALLHYLAEIITPQFVIRYHLGLIIDRTAHTLNWSNGMPYRWHYSSPEQNDLAHFPPGDPCLLVYTAVDHTEQDVDSEFMYLKYLLIQWDESSSILS